MSSPESRLPPVLTSVVGAALIAAGGATHVYHARQPLSSPEAAVRTWAAAAQTADLPSLKRASTEAHYRAFVAQFGEEKYARAKRALDWAYRLGLAHWQAARDRASTAASDAYDALQRRVQEAGRTRFAALPVEQRMRLTEDTSAFETFVFDSGLQALPEVDRRRIQNEGAFRAGSDRDSFVARERWNSLSDADRAALGGPNALSDEPTPEKMAFADREGLPLLPRDVRAELAGITRQDLADREAFAFKHGEALAGEFLKTLNSTFTQAEPCAYPRLEMLGGLLAGTSAGCSVLAMTPERPARSVRLAVRKEGFEWRIANVTPGLVQVNY